MFRRLFPLFAGAVAIAAAGPAALAQQPGPPAGMERMQNWVADHEALLNAKLAGLKAGLSLTPDQEKYWGPFEGAVREAAKLHMQHMMARMERMRAMMEGMHGQQARSPVDRLDAMAMGLAEDAAAIKNIADAARPLYDSLNDSQKQIFGWLGRELLMMGHGHPGMGRMGRHRMGMMEGEHDEMGMGGPDGRDDHMMGAGPGAMGPMHDDAGDDGNSDQE